MSVITVSQQPQFPIWRSSLRAISTLIIREVYTSYGRTPGGYIWAILTPLGMIIIMGYAWSLLARSPSLGTSFLLFKGSGLLVLGVFTGLGGTIGGALTSLKKLLLLPRMTWGDAILAKFLFHTALKFTVTFIILAGIVIYDDINTIMRWWPVMASMIFAALLGLSAGCLNAYLFKRFAVWSTIWGILTRPLLIISGVLVIYEDMPELAQRILWYNPVIHLTGLMRQGFYPMYHPEYISLLYVSLWVMIPMTIGLLLLRRYQRELLYY